jgi:GNAT superfamily N-acetyltransferase
LIFAEVYREPMMNDEAMSLHIRRAERADATQIATCLLSLGYGASAELVEAKLASFGEATDAVLVACEHALIVGVVSIHITPLFHAPGHLARVTALSIREGHQRRGIGKSLMAAAEQWSWATGAARIDLTSGNHRPKAHRFYESLGYGTDSRRFVKNRPRAE